MKLLRYVGAKVVLCEEAWPVIGDGELLVKVFAASIDPHDVLGLDLLHDGESPPAIGVGFSGKVQQLGPSCVRSDLTEGCDVVGVLGLFEGCGGLSEHVVVPESNVVIKPDGVTFSNAAAVIPGALFAYLSLQRHAQLRPGDSLLVMDGSSSIGHVVIQLASKWGAKVATTAATMGDLLFLQSSAAKHCEIADISDTITSLPFFVEEFTGGMGFDIVMDTVAHKEVSQHGDPDSDGGIAHLLAIINTLSCGGVWVSTSDSLSLSRRHQQTMFVKSASIINTNVLSIVSSGLYTNTILHILSDVLNMLDNNTLNVSISAEVDLEKAATLLNFSNKKSSSFGATVVTFS
eukprot:m.8822 g.8822  ORF g.8822 m.8822 type:complete len:347 (-) comp3266_c0_seq1:334-1374(-)